MTGLPLPELLCDIAVRAIGSSIHSPPEVVVAVVTVVVVVVVVLRHSLLLLLVVVVVGLLSILLWSLRTAPPFGFA